MEIAQLKQIAENIANGNVSSDPSYVSLLAIEQVLKKRYVAFSLSMQKYAKHIIKLLNIDCTVECNSERILIAYESFGLTPKKEYIHLRVWRHDNTMTVYGYQGADVKPKWKSLLYADEETKRFVKELNDYAESNEKLLLGLTTNVGLFVNISTRDIETIKILISDRNYDTEYFKRMRTRNDLPKCFYFNQDFVGLIVHSQNIEPTSEDVSNFYYFKEAISNSREIHFDNEEAKDIINEELIGKIYAILRVDISSLDKELQDEIRYVDMANKAGIDEQKSEEINALRRIQIDRIMRAYALIKEAMELLHNVKAELQMDRIKMDNIEAIMFKNNGLPNGFGYVEIEDFFKNNMVLRMIDLSAIDLTNVDIRNMDFSGTNIHIDPQTIYNKDMSGVNASGVKFSPFSDSFDGVILDGAIITDMEANIDLSRVQSYNSETVIGKEVIDVWGR